MVISWYYRQFVEVVEFRYCIKDMVKFLYSQLVDFFDGKWVNGMCSLYVN